MKKHEKEVYNEDLKCEYSMSAFYSGLLMDTFYVVLPFWGLAAWFTVSIWHPILIVMFTIFTCVYVYAQFTTVVTHIYNVIRSLRYNFKFSKEVKEHELQAEKTRKEFWEREELSKKRRNRMYW